MKSVSPQDALRVVFLAAAGIFVFSQAALSQGAPQTRQPEPMRQTRSGIEPAGTNAAPQNREVDFKRIEDELHILQQSINMLSKSSAQNSEASPGEAANATAPAPTRPASGSVPSVASTGMKTGAAIPVDGQFFAFSGEKSPTQTLILLLVSGIMGMIGQGARTIVGLKKLSDRSQTAAGEAETFSASRLAVGLMIGFVAGVVGGMTPKVFNAPTINSDVLFYLASIGYMGVDVIEGFANTISSGRPSLPSRNRTQQSGEALSTPPTPPPTSHDIAPTRPPPPEAQSSNEEINAALQYAADIDEAAQKHGIPAEYICGVGSRESLWGLDLRPRGPAGTGDWAPRNGRMPPDGLGWGRGLMQIDYASHPFAQTGDWRDPAANIAYGGDILGQNYDYFRQARYPGVDPLRAAIAAYNCGIGNVEHAIQAGEDVDARTTGRNYSQDVFRRAAMFQPFIGSSTLTS